MNKGITVKELATMCMEQIKKGNGDKHILVSNDDEGNGYHTLFYGLDDSKENIEYALEIEHDNHSANEVVVLG